VFLVDHLDPKHSGLVGELYQAEVLSKEERDIINAEVISFTQNEKLLSMLSRKTKDQFDKFLDALDKTGQQHVRNHVTGRQGQFFVANVQIGNYIRQLDTENRYKFCNNWLRGFGFLTGRSLSLQYFSYT